MEIETKSHLVRLIYYSIAAPSVEAKDVENILRIAELRNAVLSITGVLLYCDGHFVQALEGPRESVSRLMQSLYCDKRHYDPVIVGQVEIRDRIFPSMPMEFYNLEKVASLLPCELKQAEKAPRQLSYNEFEAVFRNIHVRTEPVSKELPTFSEGHEGYVVELYP